VYRGDLDDGKSKAHRWPAKGFPKLLASLCGLSWHARIIKCCQDSRLLSTRPSPHIHMCPGTFRLHLLPQGQGERTGFNLYEAYFISFLERFFMTARTGLLFDIIKGHFIDWFAGVSFGESPGRWSRLIKVHFTCGGLYQGPKKKKNG